MDTKHDRLMDWQAITPINYIPIVFDNEESVYGIAESMLPDVGLDSEWENEKKVKWSNLSHCAKEAIKLLVEMPDCLRRILITQKYNLIRADCGIRFFFFLCAIIGCREAEKVFAEIDEYLNDFDLPDYRLM